MTPKEITERLTVARSNLRANILEPVLFASLFDELERRLTHKARNHNAPAAPKARNVLMDAMAVIDGQNPFEVTSQAWARIAKALQQIKTAMPGVTPLELQRRAKVYKAQWPDRDLTANALASWWGACDKVKAANGSEVRIADNRR